MPADQVGQLQPWPEARATAPSHTTSDSTTTSSNGGPAKCGHAGAPVARSDSNLPNLPRTTNAAASRNLAVRRSILSMVEAKTSPMPSSRPER
jgi:hypothetical protein